MVAFEWPVEGVEFWIVLVPGGDHGARSKERSQKQQDHSHHGVQIEVLTPRKKLGPSTHVFLRQNPIETDPFIQFWGDLNY